MPKVWNTIIIIELARLTLNVEKNKNDNIHKNEVQDIRLSDEY